MSYRKRLPGSLLASLELPTEICSYKQWQQCDTGIGALFHYLIADEDIILLKKALTLPLVVRYVAEEYTYASNDRLSNVIGHFGSLKVMRVLGCNAASLWSALRVGHTHILESILLGESLKDMPPADMLMHYACVCCGRDILNLAAKQYPVPRHEWITLWKLTRDNVEARTWITEQMRELGLYVDTLWDGTTVLRDTRGLRVV